MTENRDALISYLYQSIGDIQGTIRQLDLKANAVLVFLTLILTVTDHIGAAVYSVLHSGVWWAGYLFAIGIPATWFLAIFLCYRAINAVFIRQKSDAVERAHGTFFGEAQFTVAPFAALFGRGMPREKPKLEVFYEKLPADEVAISKELAYEQLRLFYIRDVKAIRVHFAFLAAFGCLALSAIAWLLAAPWARAIAGNG